MDSHEKVAGSVEFHGRLDEESSQKLAFVQQELMTSDIDLHRRQILLRLRLHRATTHHPTKIRPKCSRNIQNQTGADPEQSSRLNFHELRLGSVQIKY